MTEWARESGYDNVFAEGGVDSLPEMIRRRKVKGTYGPPIQKKWGTTGAAVDDKTNLRLNLGLGQNDERERGFWKVYSWWTTPRRMRTMYSMRHLHRAFFLTRPHTCNHIAQTCACTLSCAAYYTVVATVYKIDDHNHSMRIRSASARRTESSVGLF